MESSLNSNNHLPEVSGIKPRGPSVAITKMLAAVAATVSVALPDVALAKPKQQAPIHGLGVIDTGSGTGRTGEAAMRMHSQPDSMPVIVKTGDIQNQSTFIAYIWNGKSVIKNGYTIIPKGHEMPSNQQIQFGKHFGIRRETCIYQDEKGKWQSGTIISPDGGSGLGVIDTGTGKGRSDAMKARTPKK